MSSRVEGVGRGRIDGGKMCPLGVELVAAVDADRIEAVHDRIEAVGVLYYNYNSKR